MPEIENNISVQIEYQSENPQKKSESDKTKIVVNNLNFYYGEQIALKNISMNILSNQVTALIGPSGCGKSTFLRLLNRMNDLIDNIKIEGELRIDGTNIYDRTVNPVNLRKKIGMIFQKSNPFPKTIFENVAYGLRVNGMVTSKNQLEEKVEYSLKQAALWEEVKDRYKRICTQFIGWTAAASLHCKSTGY
jgi:phosphate transport system ATP-binding protein